MIQKEGEIVGEGNLTQPPLFTLDKDGGVRVSAPEVKDETKVEPVEEVPWYKKLGLKAPLKEARGIPKSAAE